MAWVTGIKVTAPADGTLLVDSGYLGAGNYNFQALISAAGGAATATVQVVNISLVELRSHDVLILSGTTVPLSINGTTVPEGARFRILSRGVLTGVTIQAAVGFSS